MGLYTPPSSDIEPDSALPPSPPPSPKRIPTVDRVLGILRLQRAGRLPVKERRFKLSSSSFSDLRRRLEEDERGLGGWFHDKIRWSYEEGTFRLWMPTRVHERFIALVDDAIYRSVKEDLGLGEEIYQARSTTLELHAPRLENSSQSSLASSADEIVVHRSPDATFYHRSRDALPVCVVEVSYSQQKKDLPRLAESYIVDSRHEIRCVVGLDIAYKRKGDRSASLSVWRPGMERDENGEEVGVCECVVDGVVWRGCDGGVREGVLELDMRDFLPQGVQKEWDEEKKVRISFERLCEFLADAEGDANKTSTTTPKVSASLSSSAPKKFRKRKRSPSEELSDGREAAYLRLEEAELEKERKADSEWMGTGWTQAGAEVEGEGKVEVVERRRSKKSKSGRAVAEGS